MGVRAPLYACMRATVSFAALPQMTRCLLQPRPLYILCSSLTLGPGTQSDTSAGKSSGPQVGCKRRSIHCWRLEFVTGSSAASFSVQRALLWTRLRLNYVSVQPSRLLQLARSADWSAACTCTRIYMYIHTCTCRKLVSARVVAGTRCFGGSEHKQLGVACH